MPLSKKDRLIAAHIMKVVLGIVAVLVILSAVAVTLFMADEDPNDFAKIFHSKSLTSHG